MSQELLVRPAKKVQHRVDPALQAWLAAEVAKFGSVARAARALTIPREILLAALAGVEQRLGSLALLREKRAEAERSDATGA